MAGLITQNAELRSEIGNLKKEFEEFKKLVVEVAKEEGRERGWCSELNEILRDRLGLELPTQTLRLTIEIPLDEDGDEDWDDLGDLTAAKEFMEALVESRWSGGRQRICENITSAELVEKAEG